MIASIELAIDDTTNTLLRSELVEVKKRVFTAQREVMKAMVCVTGIVASA